jgi:hypothetical protein
MPAPILVTGYSRPDLFGNLLNQISGLGVNKYIFVDGVATEAEQEKKDLNNKCREIAFEFSEKNPNTHCFLPESNLGLSRGVTSAIDWAFSKEESLIILEDDLKLHRDALKVGSHFLDYYKDVKEIGSISLYRPAVLDNSVASRGRELYSPFTTSWGWATWYDRWAKFRREVFTENSVIRAREFFRIGGLAGLARWSGVVQALKRGDLDSWAYPWMFTHFFEHWVTVVPKMNLIENLGFGELASHTKTGASNIISSQEYLFENLSPTSFTKRAERQILLNSYGVFPYMNRVKNRLIGSE